MPALDRRRLACAIAIAVAFPPAVALAATLDDEELRQQIIGRTLKALMGPVTMRVQHMPDGSSTLRSSRRNDEGRWQIRQGQLCVRWQNLNGGEESCSTLTPLGDGRYRSSRRGMVLEVED